MATESDPVTFGAIKDLSLPLAVLVPAHAGLGIRNPR